MNPTIVDVMQIDLVATPHKKKAVAKIVFPYCVTLIDFIKELKKRHGARLQSAGTFKMIGWYCVTFIQT